MIRKLLLFVSILCLAVFVIPATAGEWVKKCGPGTDEIFVKGGFLTDLGAESIYQLKGAVNLPDFDNHVYVSADNTGYLPQGDDATADGSWSAPYRSLYQSIADNLDTGMTYIHLDDGDVFESEDDFGPKGCVIGAGDATECFTWYDLDGTWTCDDARRTCFMIGDIDGDNTTGAPGETQTMPIIDCITNSAAVGQGWDGAASINNSVMFHIGNDEASGDGWVTMQNIEWQCPMAGDDAGDMVAVNTADPGEGRLMLVNIKAPVLQGQLNQIATTHNDGYSIVLAVNTECTITEAGGDSVQCFYGLNGSYYIVGRTRLRNTGASTGVIDLVRLGTGGHYLLVMGHQLECNGRDTESGVNVNAASNALDLSFAYTGERKRTAAVFDVHIRNCNGNSSQGIMHSNSVLPAGGGFESVLKMFKVTLAENKNQLYNYINQSGIDQITYDTCNIFDNHVAGQYQIWYDLNPANSSDYIVADSLYDTSGPGLEFYFTGFRATSALVIANESFPSVATFSTMADYNATDLWEGDIAYGRCQHATCLGACGESVREAFPADEYWTQDLAGFEVHGVIKNVTRDQNIGWR